MPTKKKSIFEILRIADTTSFNEVKNLHTARLNEAQQRLKVAKETVEQENVDRHLSAETTQEIQQLQNLRSPPLSNNDAQRLKIILEGAKKDSSIFFICDITKARNLPGEKATNPTISQILDKENKLFTDTNILKKKENLAKNLPKGLEQKIRNQISVLKKEMDGFFSANKSRKQQKIAVLTKLLDTAAEQNTPKAFQEAWKDYQATLEYAEAQKGTVSTRTKAILSQVPTQTDFETYNTIENTARRELEEAQKEVHELQSVKQVLNSEEALTSHKNASPLTIDQIRKKMQALKENCTELRVCQELTELIKQTFDVERRVTVEINENKVTIKINDFGGQDVESPLQQIFNEDPTLKDKISIKNSFGTAVSNLLEISFDKKLLCNVLDRLPEVQAFNWHGLEKSLLGR